jgi:hypothetical protein
MQLHVQIRDDTANVMVEWRVVWPFPLLPFFMCLPVQNVQNTEERDMAYSSYVIKSMKSEIERKKEKLKSLQSKKVGIDKEIEGVEGEIAHLVGIVIEAEKEKAAKEAK